MGSKGPDRLALAHDRERLLRSAPRSLAFVSGCDFGVWRRQVESKLREFVSIFPDKVPLNLRIEYERDTELFRETRFVFRSEAGVDVPCHLLIPRAGDKPFPVVICLQGHTTGMHLSLGQPRYEGDRQSIAEDDDFAIQAVREGYAALALEQRWFGERTDTRVEDYTRGCHHATMTALLLGRTTIGERVWDVLRAVDALQQFPEIDTGRIGCMGNSGGGTTTYYAACLDDRIAIAMPACSICTYLESIGLISHCECNYIPGILKYFEMADLACLIAPRPLVVVAGRHDEIFPLQGVQRAYDTIQRIYDAAGASDRCRLVVGEGEHRFYADLAWPVFRELAGW